ncbi:MAG: stage 0 sporulation family protein [Thermodesulfovibrionales bacterium]|jgi:cell fate regulator YaaT (PSP1 superfamily)|nr:stage 0 sporulation family protein [Thermodesulfovibrionales bacterium]
MPDVVGIRFKSCGKIYDFEVNGIDIKEGDSVVVESDFGLSIGRVITGRHFIESPERDLKKVIRIVTDEDIKTVEENRKLEKEARDFCVERVMARGLQMKLVGAEATLDRKRIIFYFTADGRIDFRELVKDLAARFRTRIEMRQIGVRDEAKLIGGLGVCGRELCCNTFLTSFEPVSIRMAKKQELVLNVGKLSGLCGRLMCCLRYEYDGDMESISSDDELPIESEEVHEEKAGSGISAVLSKLEQSDSTEEFIETPPQPQSEQPEPEQPKSEQTEHFPVVRGHKKFRHKRRHFRR